MWWKVWAQTSISEYAYREDEKISNKKFLNTSLVWLRLHKFYPRHTTGNKLLCQRINCSLENVRTGNYFVTQYSHNSRFFLSMETSYCDVQDISWAKQAISCTEVSTEITRSSTHKYVEKGPLAILISYYRSFA